MKPKHMLMIAGVLVGIWLAFFSDKTPDSDVAQAIVRPTPSTRPIAVNNLDAPLHVASMTQTTTGNTTAHSVAMMPILALVPRSKLISIGHVDLNGKKVGATATIFGAQSWVPPPPVVVKPLHPPPPPPPVAPPLKLVFIGKKFEEGVWEVYLALGDITYVVRKNSVIEHVYRVDTITPNLVMLTYLPYNLPQRLNIKGF